MHGIRQRLYRVAARLTLAAMLTGTVFQTGGCGIQPSQMLSDLTTAFTQTLITGWVNDQLGVTNSFF